MNTGIIYDDIWIEVNFLKNKHVRAVVTQGRENYDQWVTSYQVMFKKDDQDNFTTVKDENNQPKVSIVTAIYSRHNSFFVNVSNINAMGFNTYIDMRIIFKF